VILDIKGEPNVVADMIVQYKDGSAPFTVHTDKPSFNAKTTSTKNYDTYTTLNAGTVTMDKPDIVKLSLKPEKKGWHAINLRSITLKPEE
jgi:hypothetical protein